MPSGPQKYPGASTSEWFQKKYPGDSMNVNVIVWHTTEGTSLPDYSGGSMAPTLTAVPDFKNKKLLWYQHFDFDVSARALVHATAGVATNTLNVAQVEIVGTCDPATHAKWTKAGITHLYSPELPDWAVRDLAALAKWAHANHGVPLTCGVSFKAYPASYGTSNGVRMSASTWESYNGHCGHQHVPSGNVHGDPGAFPMAAILAAATGTVTKPPATTTPTTTEKDMDLQSQVTIGDWVKAQWPADAGLADKMITVNTALGSSYAHARAAHDGTDALRTEVAALRADVAKLLAALTKEAS
jgi:hypothetical protein